MVNVISTFDASAYLGQIKGQVQPAQEAAAQAAPKPQVSETHSLQTTAPTGTKPASGSGLGLSSDLLSLLHGVSASSSTPSVASLLGDSVSSSTTSVYNLVGSSSASPSTDGLSGLYDQLLHSKNATEPLKQAVAAAKQQTAEGSASSSAVQTVVSNYTQGLNAYNKVLQQNATTLVAQTAKALVS